MLLPLILPWIVSSCPIPGGCTGLPNISQYRNYSLNNQLLQLSLNISTTNGHTFRPQGVQPTLYTENMNMGSQHTHNGCDNIFNFTSRDVGVESPCPWRYKCDYNPQRIPAFIFHASCERATPQGDQQRGVCEEVHYPISYIMTRSCDPFNSEDVEWLLETTTLPVVCNLKDTATF